MARRAPAMLGTCYVLCFDPPYVGAQSRPDAKIQTVRHYIGWTHELEERAIEHMKGTGANVVRVAMAAGCSMELALEIPRVTRDFERTLKRYGGAARLCPRCSEKPRPLTRALARDRARQVELGLA